MPDKIDIHPDLKLVSINSYDEVSDKDIGNSIKVITDLYEAGKIDKVLVDTTKQSVLPNYMQLYKLSEQFPFGLKIALITVQGQMTLEDLKFFELTSSNKGKLLRIFDSLEKANKWLSD